MPENISAIERYLSNPVLLLVVGAALSGLLVPSIINQWQSYQKELDLKTAPIPKISEQVSSDGFEDTH